MTPVQSQGLPDVIKGSDLIAQAKTGSGKTATFALGILNSVNEASTNIQALVLCPTRELAEQVAKEMRILARGLKNIRVLTLCGGVPESEHRRALYKGAHIAVGTPGRILQLLETESLDVSELNNYTLDEADKMLGMGFYEDIIELSAYLPKKRQTLLFSATFPENIKNLSSKIQINVTQIEVDTQHNPDVIDQVFYEITPDDDKNAILYKLLNHHRPERAIVFCRTKKDTVDIAHFLKQRRIFVKHLNGDLEQRERTEVLINFSNRSLSVLVATDIAARGLDIADLEAVINYNMPSSREDYTHRIGRTGRAENTGLAISFFTDYERPLIEEIAAVNGVESKTKTSLEIPKADRYNLIPPMRTIYINGGKKDKLRPGDIVGALLAQTQMHASDVGDISIFSQQSFVAIKSDMVKKAIETLSSGKIKKRKFKVGHISHE